MELDAEGGAVLLGLHIKPQALHGKRRLLHGALGIWWWLKGRTGRQAPAVGGQSCHQCASAWNQVPRGVLHLWESTSDHSPCMASVRFCMVPCEGLCVSVDTESVCVWGGGRGRRHRRQQPWVSNLVICVPLHGTKCREGCCTSGNQYQTIVPAWPAFASAWCPVRVCVCVVGGGEKAQAGRQASAAVGEQPCHLCASAWNQKLRGVVLVVLNIRSQALHCQRPLLHGALQESHAGGHERNE
jgi:hypothetical protein